MSKVTVITDNAGQIHAIGHGHLSEKSMGKSGSSKLQAGLRAGPGQKLHELEAKENLEEIKSWPELHQKVQQLIKH